MVSKLAPLVKERGYTLLEFALGFVLSHEEVSVALCGMRNSEQLSSLLKARGHLPNKEELKEFSDIVGLS